jgi:hypothetical protein
MDNKSFLPGGCVNSGFEYSDAMLCYVMLRLMLSDLGWNCAFLPWISLEPHVTRHCRLSHSLACRRLKLISYNGVHGTSRNQAIAGIRTQLALMTGL